MGGTNLYQYAPNPVAWVDPLGLMKSRTSAKKIANQRAKQLQNDKNSPRMVTIVVDRKREKIYEGTSAGGEKKGDRLL